jgi:hypothetical protein
VGSAYQGYKEKEKRRWGSGLPRERKLGRWAGWARMKVRSFFFFLFLFQTLFKLNLFNSNSIKTFQTFSQNFINLLNLTQATKNHAYPNNDAQTLVVSKLIKLN